MIAVATSPSVSNLAMHTKWSMAMGQASATRPTDVGLLPKDFGPKVRAFLKRMYPTGTAKSVSRDTLIPLETVEKLLERGSAPNFAGYIALTVTYGPDFLEAVVDRPPAWVLRAVKAEKLAKLTERQAEIEREMAELREC